MHALLIWCSVARTTLGTNLLIRCTLELLSGNWKIQHVHLRDVLKQKKRWLNFFQCKLEFEKEKPLVDKGKYIDLKPHQCGMFFSAKSDSITKMMSPTNWHEKGCFLI